MKIRAAAKAPDLTGEGYANHSRRMRLMDPIGGTVLYLMYLPDELAEAGLADVWEQTPRPGRKPLLQRTGKALPVASFTVRLMNRGQEGSVGGDVRTLKRLAKADSPLRLDMAGQFLGLYRVTGLSVRQTKWTRGGNPSDAEADVELTTASDGVAAIGPVPRLSGIKGQMRGAARPRRKRNR